jgi:hypothetical protein
VFDVDKCGTLFKFGMPKQMWPPLPASMDLCTWISLTQPFQQILRDFTSGDYDSNSRTRVNGLRGKMASRSSTPAKEATLKQSWRAILSLNTSNFQSLNLAFMAER